MRPRSHIGVGLLALTLALSACDDLGLSPPSRPSAPEPTAAGAPAEAPRLADVPRRPRLTYDLAQEREIQRELAADRDNARYQGQELQREAGLRTAPPDPPLPEPALGREPSPSPEEPPDPAATFVTEAMQQDKDDGSLGDFLDALERGQAAAVASPQPGEPETPQAEPQPPETQLPEPQQVEAEPPESQLAEIPQAAPMPAETGAAAVPPADELPAAVAPTIVETPLPVVEAPAPAEPMLADEAEAPAQMLAETPPLTTVAAATPRAEPAVAPLPSLPPGPLRPMTMLFAPGSAVLPVALVEQVGTLAVRLKLDGSGVRIRAEGDPPSLALDRARAVAVRLVLQGVPGNWVDIETGGAGETVVVYPEAGNR